MSLVLSALFCRGGRRERSLLLVLMYELCISSILEGVSRREGGLDGRARAILLSVVCTLLYIFKTRW